MRKLGHVRRYADRVAIAHNSLYGQYNIRQQAEAAAELTDRVLKILDWTLTIPDNVVYVITKITGSTAGAYSPGSRQVHIDGRQPPDRLIDVVCHESVHIDQVARGDLSWTNRGSAIWQGVEFPNIADYTHQQYRQSPWEQEAFARQVELSSIVRPALCL